ncbi:hypothetical protein [Bacillus subtilis]|nr:hypothetical protein [Bacillus subtilis]GLI90503.1 hypothetical protein ANABIO4_38550 [Bacillus subtilis]
MKNDNIRKMEKQLGIDRAIPANLTTENDPLEDDSYYEDWYAEELEKRVNNKDIDKGV